jgi:hypothetical protein
MKKIFGFGFALPVILVFMFSCGTGTQRGATNEETEKKEKEIDSIATKAAAMRTAYLQELSEMNNEQLAQQLLEESDRGLEPFNSLAYKETIERGSKIAELLVRSVKDTTRTSLLSLLALNEIDRKMYDKVGVNIRVAILLDALRNSKLYNAFGLPHVRIEFAGETIIKEGENIRKGLMGLLSDTKPAPVWGSEDYGEYLNYKYRVCDYALFFLKKIDGDEEFTISQTQEGRDTMIAEILQSNN